MELFTFRNEDALRCWEVAQDKEFCCQLLKTEPLNVAIKTLGLEALITGVRWDENPVRAVCPVLNRLRIRMFLKGWEGPNGEARLEIRLSTKTG